MKVEMLMPQMGESITEATILRWLKKVGDVVTKDETILEISTDKVDSEIPAPSSGVLSEILFQEGDVVPVKVKIAVIDTAAKEGAQNGAMAPTKTDSAPAASSPSPSASSSSTASLQAPTASSIDQDHEDTALKLSPLVRKLAEQHGVTLDEIATIKGSGQGGRVTKQDFLAYVETKNSSSPVVKSTQATAPLSSPSPAMKPPVKSSNGKEMPTLDEWRPDGTKVVVMDRMRQAIADHMVRSKHTSPHVYSVQEVDVTNIALWREAHKNSFKKNEGFNLSFTPFFLEAAVRGLVEYPLVNASVQEKSIVLKKHVNLGCAVALGNTGLIVPVIKKAEELTFMGIARGLNDIALRARDKKLLPDDVAGGTFTVTNPGVFGTLIGTPIINQPQVAILCLGAIEKRPVVINDMIAIRQMCYLTLSYDHRIIDGSLGGQFLAFIKKFLESWELDRRLS